MSNPAKEILVIGLGLIGSSLAKAAKNKGLIVHGFDEDKNSLNEALNKNIIDSSFESLQDINDKSLVKKVDILIVAVSPRATQVVKFYLKHQSGPDTQDHNQFLSLQDLVFLRMFL